MFCRYCGATIADGSKTCPECGERLSNAKVYSVSAKDRTTAIALCCLGLLGVGGLHRMYVGQWGLGAIYAITVGLCFIGTFYDLYLLFSETFKDCNGFPLYAESSIKKDYKRREPKDDTHMAIKVIAVMCALFMSLNAIINAIMVISLLLV